VDLCKAIAAAIFGSQANTLELIDVPTFERFEMLQGGQIDVLARLTTHTMERDVYETTTSAGFTFSSPYLYSELVYGGVPFFTNCTDSKETTGNCTDLRICVLGGTTHAEVLANEFPDNLVQSPSTTGLYRTFSNGLCNVLAGDPWAVAETAVRSNGYAGDYVLSSTVLASDPIALVTREGDPGWSDFVNWVLVGLQRAEERNVGISNPAVFNFFTNIFGDAYRTMFIQAIAAVGNYGEIYERHLQDIVPRQPINQINAPGSSGLLFAHPYGGNLVRSGVSRPTPGGTLQTVKARGLLRCGVKRQPGFAITSPGWTGFDVDYCNAISAALFDGAINVEFIELRSNERFPALVNGTVDVLTGMAAATFTRDVRESTTGVGLTFAQTTIYDRLAFGGIPP